MTEREARVENVIVTMNASPPSSSKSGLELSHLASQREVHEASVAEVVDLANDRAVSVVTTSARFDLPAQLAWQGILYYEQIDRRPPPLLRLLLPTPVRVHGPKAQVGDESLCHYETGYLKKRVTAVEPGRRFCFEVLEQALRVGAVRLQGGSYELTPLADGRVRVTLVTRYRSRLRPRGIFRWVEDAVCHAFHRHILRMMEESIASRVVAKGALPEGSPPGG